MPKSGKDDNVILNQKIIFPHLLSLKTFIISEGISGGVGETDFEDAGEVGAD